MKMKPYAEKKIEITGHHVQHKCAYCDKNSVKRVMYICVCICLSATKQLTP